jgi:hypothetical protein
MSGKVKGHFKRNKKLYIGIGIGVGVTVVATAVIIAVKNPALIRQSAVVVGKNNVVKQSLSIHIEALGDPGNIIQNVKTGTVYASQGQAARELGISAARLSQHLTGARAHVNGHVFVKLGKAAVSAV